MRRQLSTLALICAAGLALPVVAAHANDTAPASAAADANSQVVTFKPDYFKDFQPSTAFDMVLRVPGFAFDGGEQARGYSGTAGNVLIDGQRPATKQDLGNTLSNINAQQVDHLELITGGAPGIDMHGHRQIVNVVRKQDAKPNFSVLGIYRNMDGRTDAGVLLFTYNDNRNGKSTDITADIFNFFDNGANNGQRVTNDGSGPDVMKIYQHAGGHGIESQGSHSRPFLGGKITFTGTYNPSIYHQNARYEDSSGTATERFMEDDKPGELGMQFERKFKKGFDLNLNALARHETDDVVDLYEDASGLADYRALSVTDEHILNGRVGWQKREGLSFAAGTETAFNSLDRRSSFVMNANSPNVPTNRVKVEEDRNESFVSANWQATKKLGFEAELKVENSTISVPASKRSDSFTYYKPRFQAVYAFNDKTKLSWKTLRQVDQLSFGGFASSVQLNTSQVTLGNTALVPQKDWLNTLILEHSFWDKGAITVALEHYEYQDTSDYIAIIDGTDVYTAQGNIGDSQRNYVHVKLDLPLDKLHVPHGTFNLDYTYRQSEVKDPITGRKRAVSGIQPNVVEASFSQEFPKSGTSWGIDVQGPNIEKSYLANELDYNRFDPWTQIWFQYKTPKKLTFKIMIKNPFGLRYHLDRTVYQGLRDQTPVAFTQSSSYMIPPILELRLKKDF